MKKFKKFLAIAISVMMIAALAGCSSNGSGDGGKDAIKVAVFLYKFDDTYISTVRQSLQSIQEENKGNVTFEFFDGKGDQATQNDAIDTALQKDFDLLMVNIVDIGAGQTVIDKISAADKPVIFFNREPKTEELKSYDKARFVGTNAKDAGILQGEILADIWNDKKDTIDKNDDGVLQYVMLKGEPDNPEAVARTEFSVSTLKDKDIKVEELGLQVCNWQQDLAQTAMEAWFSKYGDKIEAVIANNDGMALGAVAALQNQGYNDGKDKYIHVVGVDATEAAQDYINQGYMSGTVLQDAPAMAKALYECATNMASGKDAVDGTSYKYDDTGIAVRIPYAPFIKK
ncbi:galactose ABC transporter substrate-binding protein [Clostridium culturomicium]|uniref:galactose ABC transporter substrate-binding protein n=1 Tax=Clostridium culturomicium TaxID=1499683 RepID=UPI00058E1328|nr:galactose ABC transporter substrate-binding protein [Clostridium culturomicium]